MPTDPVVDPKSSRARIVELEAENEALTKRVVEIEAGVIAEVDALFTEAEKKMLALSADRDHWFNVATQLREQLNGRALTIPTKAAGDPRLRGFK